MTLSIAILILAGLAGLAIGGELLVRGSVGIAQRLGISTLVTGVVIVGSATSMPEMVASVQAALTGSPEIAWGNIAGSNIANSLLILGAAAMVAPIALTGAGKRDAVVGVLAGALVWGIAWSGWAAGWIGAVLLALIVIYVIWRIRHPAKTLVEDAEEDVGAPTRLVVAVPVFAAGVAALVFGGQWLVTGAVQLAENAGIAETVIGLTIVAVGTSLPELAASVAAALRGQSGLAIGNVVGSNIFNLLLIGGATMTIAPTAIPSELLDIEWPVMVAAAVLVYLLCAYGKRIGRVMGALLLAGFVANTAMVVLYN
ncbi:calcium/sodium antiporter [Qipengyuania sp. JC766]|uniref:calcium/sodium antiporter n=1 Tax=Qipengyuania sp. JC766 TaxID=3232139 RepID=UPI00345AFE71